MSTLSLTPTRMQEGIWRAMLKQAGQGVPQVDVLHADQPVPDVALREVDADNQLWELEVPIPKAAIADGVQTFVISDKSDGEVLGQFSLSAGEALGEDVRAEVELLRAELDMLKRAFRRHCLDPD